MGWGKLVKSGLDIHPKVTSRGHPGIRFGASEVEIWVGWTRKGGDTLTIPGGCGPPQLPAVYRKDRPKGRVPGRLLSGLYYIIPLSQGGAVSRK